MDTLIDKTILITGASSGIGKQIALSLLNYKLNLYLLGRNITALKKIKEKAGKADVRYDRVDFSNDSDFQLFLKNLKESSFEPDILIHSAGVFHHGKIHETCNEIIDYTYKVNFRAPFIITRELLDIIKNKKGQIIFINSTASLHPRPNNAVYASFKGALTTFAEAIRQEVKPFKVRVISVFPGRVNTPMQKYVLKMEAIEFNQKELINVDEFAEFIINIIKLPQNIEVSQVILRPS